MTKLEIPRIKKPSLEVFIDRYFEPSLPVVIEGGLDGWRAISTWTPEHLADVAGSRDVEVTTETDGYFNKPRMPETMSLRAYVALLQNPNSSAIAYIKQQDISVLPELAADVQPIPYASNTSIRLTNLWFGPGGTKTPLHFDRYENLFAQVYGKKSFELVHPEDLDRTYLRALDSGAPHISDVRCDAVDLEKHPKFAGARRAQVTLEKGEMLFLPAYWFHEVTSLETSISVNTWLQSKLSRFTTPGALREVAIAPFFLPPPILFEQFEAHGLGALADHVELLLRKERKAGALLFAGFFLGSFLAYLGMQKGLQIEELLSPRTPEEDEAFAASIVESSPLEAGTKESIRRWMDASLAARKKIVATNDFSGIGSDEDGKLALEISNFIRSQTAALGSES